MIDHTHIARIKKAFGSHYTNILAEKLQEIGLVNRKGQRYTSSSLRNFINNPERQSNTALATGILQVLITEEKRQKQLLNDLKTK